MKTFLWVLAITTLAAANAKAQSTKIELYADANRTTCELVDQGTTLQTIYVFQTGSFQSTGVRFRVTKPACWTGATWVGDMTPFVALGNSQTDWSVAYGVCKTLPVLIGQINFFATGASQPCCELLAQPATQFVYTNCSFGEYPLVAGQKVVVNATDACRCQSPLATEPTTWGRVKSLYR